MTVLEVIQRSSEFLERKEVDSPRLQSELLLAHVLALPRMKLYLNFDRVLTPQELDSVRAFVQRRGTREPLQHILGTAWFCGLELAVDRTVLIPRPETELLAEHAGQFLAKRPGPSPLALDFATGSGCLAIAIAVGAPQASLTAVDISAPAVAIAQANAARHGVAGRIRFHVGDGLAAVPAADRLFDLIVSNPPYIPTAEIATLQPEVRDYDPALALDGGADGLDFYRRLAADTGSLLAGDGRMMLELGAGQAEPVTQILAAQGWHRETLERDPAGIERILIARRLV